MIGEFFLVLGGAGYVVARTLKEAFTKSTSTYYSHKMRFNLQRQMDIQIHEVNDPDPKKRAEIDEKLGYKLDHKCQRDRIVATKKLIELEGYTYYDMEEQRVLNPAYRKANSIRKPGNWEVQRKLHDMAWYRETGAWRFEHPHGKDVPVSPFKFGYKEAYFAAVDRECKRLGIWGSETE